MSRTAELCDLSRDPPPRRLAGLRRRLARLLMSRIAPAPPPGHPPGYPPPEVAVPLRAALLRAGQAHPEWPLTDAERERLNTPPPPQPRLAACPEHGRLDCAGCPGTRPHP